MNYYRIKYTCDDGYSETLYIKAAYMVCQEIAAMRAGMEASCHE